MPEQDDVATLQLVNANRFDVQEFAIVDCREHASPSGLKPNSGAASNELCCKP